MRRWPGRSAVSAAAALFLARRTSVASPSRFVFDVRTRMVSAPGIEAAGLDIMETAETAAERAQVDRAIAGVLFHAGLRRSEAADLRWGAAPEFPRLTGSGEDDGKIVARDGIVDYLVRMPFTPVDWCGFRLLPSWPPDCCTALCWRGGA